MPGFGFGTNRAARRRKGGAAPTLIAQTMQVDGVTQQLMQQRGIGNAGSFEVVRVRNGEVHNFLVRGGWGGALQGGGTSGTVFRQPTGTVGTQVATHAAGSIRVNGVGVGTGQAAAATSYIAQPGMWIGNKTAAASADFYRAFDKYTASASAGSSQTNAFAVGSTAQGYVVAYAMGNSLTADEIIDFNVAVHKAVRQVGA